MKQLGRVIISTTITPVASQDSLSMTETVKV